MRLVGLRRYPKRAILVIGDMVMLSLALWLAMSLRFGEFYIAPSWQLHVLFHAAPLIGVATFFQVGLYRLVTRFSGAEGATLIAFSVGLSALLWALLVLLSGVSGVPRSVVILYPILGLVSVWGSRQLAGWLLRSARAEVAAQPQKEGGHVLIYGAGTTGVQIKNVLCRSGIHVPVAFVDATPTLWRQYIAGLRVYRPERLAKLIKDYDVKEVILALPGGQRRERRAALRQLEPLAVKVRELPAIEDVAAGRVTVSDLRPVEVGDLLGREAVPADGELLARSIKDRSVMVTGAGGSIGSELVRQILQQGPRQLVLYDVDEARLYEIELEARGYLLAQRRRKPKGLACQPEVTAVLGSVLDAALVRRTLADYQIETIYHAAAFKHVPMVEENPVAGLRNNAFGTSVLAEAAEASGVERFVLISTDKAVRPTSIMGASKRLAEMILQTRAAASNGRTVFTMVRFGNVLDSSGSVVRRFRAQIEAGGPVTVTHPDMIRYFMSIPEAAGLVIQAGAMATGGDLFILDMGQPARIDDLARSMIRLMGAEVCDAQNPDGDIEIEYIGLRNGEKLREELLLSDNTTPTEHPQIFKCHEPRVSERELASILDAMRVAMDGADGGLLREALLRGVEGYAPELRPQFGRDQLRSRGKLEDDDVGHRLLA